MRSWGQRNADAATARCATTIENEPFVSADALDHFILLGRVHDALIADAAIDEARLCRRLQAEGELPSGAAGAQRLREILRQARPITDAVHAARRGALGRLPFEIALGDVRLAGTLNDVDDAQAIRTRVGKVSARNIVRWHLDALVLAALGDPRPVLTFANFDGGDVGPRALAAHPREDARDALRGSSVSCAAVSQTRCLFRPTAAWAWLDKVNDDATAADEAAAKQWITRTGGGEGTDAATLLALRGAMPFVDDSATIAFRAWATNVFAAICDARRAGARGMTTPIIDWPLEGTHRIEASAGTGKTWTISVLYLRLLLEQEFSPAQIVVTTFTDAAAQELRERVRARIAWAQPRSRSGDCRRAASVATDGDDRRWLHARWRDGADSGFEPARAQADLKRLRLAQSELDRAPIGTLHGLCRRILADHPFESGSASRDSVRRSRRDAINAELIDDLWRQLTPVRGHAADADDEVWNAKARARAAGKPAPRTLLRTRRPVAGACRRLMRRGADRRGHARENTRRCWPPVGDRSQPACAYDKLPRA